MRARAGTAGRRCLLAAIPAIALACAGAPAVPVWEARLELDGDFLRIVVRDPETEPARSAVQAALAAGQETWARLRPSGPGSEVDLLGKVPMRLWVQVSRSTFDALAVGAAIAEATEGAYDYTWPPLRKPWGLRTGDTPRVPRDFEITTAMRRVDWEDVELREDDAPEARRLSRRTEIELGDLAIGAVVDAAADQLRALGVVAARVESRRVHRAFGGSARTPWRIELAELAVELAEGAVAETTWGAARATGSGETIREVLDPRDGRPVSSRFAAAVAENAAAAAAWARAGLCLGPEEALEAASENEGLQLAVAPGEGQAVLSPGFPVGR